jgi:hypothetical protein
MPRRTLKVALSVLACVVALFAVSTVADDGNDLHVSRVLLISVDGLHAIDLKRFIETHPDSALAWLSAHGRTYTQATSSKPTDSFPGLLAMVTGGTPRSARVFYDDAYDRFLAPAGATSAGCVHGTEVMWKQNLDFTPLSFTTTIDPTKLPLLPNDQDPSTACTSRVYPHQYPRVNNVFELIKAAGGRTAWSDKHPAYEFLMGLSGNGVDDLYTPEIATTTSGVTTTNSFALTMAYDDMKVAAIRNEIKGFDHTGTTFVGPPTIFGLNFQAASVGQKLKTDLLAGAPLCPGNLPCIGGYLDQDGPQAPQCGAFWYATPKPDGGVRKLCASNGLLRTLEHTDQSIGSMVMDLSDQGLLDSTLIIISAKHGNSPIDLATLAKVDPLTIKNIVNSVPPGLAQLSADTGPLIWLNNPATTPSVVAALNNSIVNLGNPARIDKILWGADLTDLFGPSDVRSPDIVLVPLLGTVYTTSGSKIADHGGFSDDDVHVALLVSNPSLRGKSIDDPVETRQIACTILKAVSLECDGLQSQLVEPSKFLPNSNHNKSSDPLVTSEPVGPPGSTHVRRRPRR